MMISTAISRAVNLQHSTQKVSKRRPERDKIIEGTVVRIDQDTVLVDIGLKSEGHVPASEFRDANGEITVQVGDKIRVLMTRRGWEKRVCPFKEESRLSVCLGQNR